MKSTSQIWLDLLANLLEFGEAVSPRGHACLELMHVQSTIDMNDPCVTVAARRLSPQFLAAEAAWIISGDNRVETIAPFAPSIIQFSDNGSTFFGAYGPKFIEQFDYIVQCLMSDPCSRQAVLNIWRENPRPTKDVPCTTNVQWLIRNDRLHCVDTMRSSDVWLGWPYDIFNFSMMSAVILLELRQRGQPLLQLGTLTLQAGSQHLYLRNKDRAFECLTKPTCRTYESLKLDEVSSSGLPVHLWKVARKQGPFYTNFLIDLE